MHVHKLTVSQDLPNRVYRGKMEQQSLQQYEIEDT